MRIIRNYDVGSYYPHLMTINHYTSRSIPSPETYEQVLETRMKAKAEGDKTTANALKLICNTTYGATLNRYNALYDPLNARSVCISGQLYLLEMACHLRQNIPDLKIVQLNTDGIMIEFDNSYTDAVTAITQEWQDRTGFSLEEDQILAIWQKDVNNYIEINSEDTKIKGSYLVRGIAKAGAFNINNNSRIVAEAIRLHFTDNIPVEETINACNDPSMFQIIAKAGGGYSAVFLDHNRTLEPVQRVNRVFATTDEQYGRLYKQKTGQNPALIGNLPDHCYINNLEPSIPMELLDKNYYINLANKQIDDFLGLKKKGRNSMAVRKTEPKPETQPEQMTSEVKPEQVTPIDFHPMNIYQKLTKARRMFVESGVSKSGINQTGSGYLYFELKDIVPEASRIFDEVGLTHQIHFPSARDEDQVAEMVIINADFPVERMVFSSPIVSAAPIVSNAGKRLTTDLQLIGSTQTYMRRYLWMQVLDVVETSTVDKGLKELFGGSEESKKDERKPLPTPAERAQIAEAIAGAEEQATELQLKQLKKGCKKLITIDPSYTPKIEEITLETLSFTKVSKKRCEELMIMIGDEIARAETDNKVQEETNNDSGVAQ